MTELPQPYNKPGFLSTLPGSYFGDLCDLDSSKRLQLLVVYDVLLGLSIFPVCFSYFLPSYCFSPSVFFISCVPYFYTAWLGLSVSVLLDSVVLCSFLVCCFSFG